MTTPAFLGRLAPAVEPSIYVNSDLNIHLSLHSNDFKKIASTASSDQSRPSLIGVKLLYRCGRLRSCVVRAAVRCSKKKQDERACGSRKINTKQHRQRALPNGNAFFGCVLMQCVTLQKSQSLNRSRQASPHCLSWTAAGRGDDECHRKNQNFDKVRNFKKRA